MYLIKWHVSGSVCLYVDDVSLQELNESQHNVVSFSACVLLNIIKQAADFFLKMSYQISFSFEKQ